jgi:alpha-ketoglutarate-dependent taurine dioxygenase
MKLTKIEGLGSYGVYIDGVDFEHMTDDQWMEIGKIHMENLVTIIRDCNLSWENQMDWVQKFGASRNNFSYNMLTKYNEKSWKNLTQRAFADDPSLLDDDKRDIKTAFNVAKFTKEGKHVAKVSGQKDKDGNPLGLFAEGELTWHSNEGGQLTFTPGVSLLGAEGVVGSSTGFVTTVDYYENVSDSFRSELDDMVIIHKFRPGVMTPGLREEQDLMLKNNMCPVDGTEVPLVIQSPAGIKGLHYPLNTIYQIKGMSKEESDKVFAEINKGLFTEEYVYDHWYKNDGDFLLFDNSITLHRRLGETKNRMCYRVQHDYSNLQDEAWQPYFQKEYANQYVKEITDIVTRMNFEDFKLPSCAA